MTNVVDELFLPEPEPREVQYTVISVDDHVVEPPHMFEGRLPAHAAGPGAADRRDAARATRSGSSTGERYTQVGMNAVAGRRPETVKLEPFRFDQMRPGCYDIDARVRDMDINGVWASVNFPSHDHRLLRPGVLAVLRSPSSGSRSRGRGTTGCSRSGTRRTPSASSRSGITFLADPELGAAEIRRNAERGLHVGDAARAPAPHRPAVDLSTRATGTRSSRRASRPTP